MPVYSTTYWTPLTGVLRTHPDDLLAGKGGLVRQLLLQVVVGPRYRDVAGLSPHALRRASDARKVLQHEQSPLRVRPDECLGHAMVHIAHPAVLPVADGLEPASCRRGLPLLKFLSCTRKLRSLGLDAPAAPCRGLRPVVGDGKLSDAAVDADHIDNVSSVGDIDLVSDGDVQENLPVISEDKVAVPYLQVMRSRYFSIPDLTYGSLILPSSVFTETVSSPADQSRFQTRS